MSMEQALKCTTHILKTLCDSTATSGYRIRRLFVVQGTSLLDETYHQQLAGVSCQQALLQGSSPWLGKANAATVFGLARLELVPAVDNHFPKQPDLAWQPLGLTSFVAEWGSHDKEDQQGQLHSWPSQQTNSCKTKQCERKGFRLHHSVVLLEASSVLGRAHQTSATSNRH